MEIKKKKYKVQVTRNGDFEEKKKTKNMKGKIKESREGGNSPRTGKVARVGGELCCSSAKFPAQG